MAKISSSSSLFAKRGNPWISPRDREQLARDYKRNPETENPDLDQYDTDKYDLSFAGRDAFDRTEEGMPGHDKLLRKAPKRPVYIDPPPIGVARAADDLQLKAAQIMLKSKSRWAKYDRIQEAKRRQTRG